MYFLQGRWLHKGHLGEVWSILPAIVRTLEWRILWRSVHHPTSQMWDFLSSTMHCSVLLGHFAEKLWITRTSPERLIACCRRHEDCAIISLSNCVLLIRPDRPQDAPDQPPYWLVDISGQSDVKEEIVHTLYLTFVTSQSRNLYYCIATGADTPDIRCIIIKNLCTTWWTISKYGMQWQRIDNLLVHHHYGGKVNNTHYNHMYNTSEL